MWGSQVNFKKNDDTHFFFLPEAQQSIDYSRYRRRGHHNNIMKLNWLFVLLLSFCFQLILTENAASVDAIEWRADAIHYATEDVAQDLIRECEFFIV